MKWYYWVLIAAAAVLLILALLNLVGWFFFNMAIVRHAPGKAPKVKSNTDYSEYVKRLNAKRDELLAMSHEQFSITSYDGLTLRARYYKAGNSKKTVICVHGFRSTGEFDYGSIARMYLDRGYNTLVVSQRAHSESDGEYITFGMKERFDVAAWADFVDEHFGHDTKVYLHGISMGAASVLMAVGLPHRADIRAVVADCGLTSAYDEFAFVLKHNFHLPKQPILFFADSFCRRKADFSIDEYSTLDAMKVNITPVLFIHGQKDVFVPPIMSEQNYEACKAPKEILRIPNAIHATSFYDSTQLYTDTVMKFFAQHC